MISVCFSCWLLLTFKGRDLEERIFCADSIKSRILAIDSLTLKIKKFKKYDAADNIFQRRLKKKNTTLFNLDSAIEVSTSVFQSASNVMLFDVILLYTQIFNVNSFTPVMQ